MYIKLQKKVKIFLAAICYVCIGNLSFSQSISRPIVSDACFVNANELQNISSTITGSSIPSGTDFILRLSNKSGGFNSNSIVIAQTENTGDQIVFSDFSYPIVDGEATTLGSDTYRLRIEQLNSDLESPRSNEFSAYFYDGTLLQLNPRVLCEFGELRAIPSDLSEYIWHRVTSSGGDQIIEGESGNTLQANIEGDYYFTPQLGNCSGFIPEARSNFVTVFEATETEVPDFMVLIENGTTPMCASEQITLTTNLVDPSNTNFTFQWIKNDEIINGETNPSITISGIDAEGEYFLEVSDDSQRSRQRCSKQSTNRIFVDLNNPFISFAEGQSLILPDIPGQEEVLNVTTTGEQPLTIQWFKDNIAIPNSNTNQINASGAGEYTARVTGSSCTINENVTENSITVVDIDNLEVRINYDNPNYTDCVLSQIGLVVESVTTEVNNSVVSLDPNTFPVEDISWVNNSNPVSQFAGPNILIEDASSNGSYVSQITIGSSVFTSNMLEVKLNPGELSIEATDTILNEDIPTATLSVILSEEAIASLYTYRWFREDFQAPNGQTEIATSNTVEVNTAGNYFVEVTFDDCPTERLETITIITESTVIPNILTPNGVNNRRWELPARYTNQPNISIQIISSSGVEVLNQNNYNGTWPDQQLSESVYYYIISENNSPLEKGSITIIR